MDANSLYPVVSGPVPVGTPMISPLVQWDHSQVWDIPKVEHFSHSSGGSKSAAVYNIGKNAVFDFIACVLIQISYDFFFTIVSLIETEINSESSDNYLIEHCIDGRFLYPATGYLVLAWRTLVRSRGIVMESTPISFEDVKIHRATILPKTGERPAGLSMDSSHGLMTQLSQLSCFTVSQGCDSTTSSNSMPFPLFNSAPFSVVGNHITSK